MRATLFVALACAVLCALGVWQLQRLAWKENLIATLSTRLAQPPVDLSRLTPPLADHEWQPVTVKGRFDQEGSVLVGPRTLDGQVGAHVFTPLILKDGTRIIVNRGFVPVRGEVKTPSGTQSISGVVRVPAPGRFTPDNRPEQGQWYWPDLAAMLGAADGITDVYLQQTSAQTAQWPRSVTVTPDLPNNHAQYAAFWFGMAGLALGVFALARRGRRS